MIRSVNVKKTKSSKKIVLKITMSMTLPRVPMLLVLDSSPLSTAESLKRDPSAWLEITGSDVTGLDDVDRMGAVMAGRLGGPWIQGTSSSSR